MTLINCHTNKFKVGTRHVVLTIAPCSRQIFTWFKSAWGSEHEYSVNRVSLFYVCKAYEAVWLVEWASFPKSGCQRGKCWPFLLSPHPWVLPNTLPNSPVGLDFICTTAVILVIAHLSQTQLLLSENPRNLHHLQLKKIKNPPVPLPHTLMIIEGTPNSQNTCPESLHNFLDFSF